MNASVAHLSDQPLRPASVRRVQEIVAEEFGLSPDIMTSASHINREVHVRWVAMDICRALFKINVTQIGRRFKKNHSTVLRGLRNLPTLLAVNDEFSTKTAALRTRFGVEDDHPEMN